MHKLQICKSRMSLSHYKINRTQISVLHNTNIETNKPDNGFERRAGSWKVTKRERVQLELLMFSFENFLKVFRQIDELQ